MSSSREVTAEALSLIQNALEKSEREVLELRAELERKPPSKSSLEQRLDVITHRLEKAEQDRESWETEASHREELIENANAKIDQLKARLEIAESGPDKLTKKEVNYWRAKAESFDQETAEYKARLVTMRHELNARDDELAELGDAATENSEAASRAADRLDELNDATARTRVYQEELAAASAEQHQLKNERNALSETLQEREAELREQAAQRALLEAENARLNEEVAEERERSEAAGELANDRFDLLTKSREQVEEIEERFEESEWHRRNSAHFERIVQRRKGLIFALIAAIRAKTKSNNALKAGLDSLRRYKAAALETEQKLLSETEQLKSALGEAREKLERAEGATSNQRRLSDSEQRANELDEKVKTQAELIASLEEELRLAKVVQTDLRQKVVDAESQFSEKQKSMDKAAASSHASTENDRLMIDALERETAELREKLENQGGGEDLSAELEKHVKKIQELTEESNAWKRKYEFLATDAPEAYQTQAVAEK